MSRDADGLPLTLRIALGGLGLILWVPAILLGIGAVLLLGGGVLLIALRVIEAVVDFLRDGAA